MIKSSVHLLSSLCFPLCCSNTERRNCRQVRLCAVGEARSAQCVVMLLLCFLAIPVPVSGREFRSLTLFCFLGY